MNEIEHRICQLDGIEFRQEGDAFKVRGTVVKYGDTARLRGGFIETVTPGGVRLDNRIIANYMHDRGKPLAVYPHNMDVELRDDRVYASFDLPSTTVGRDTQDLIERKILDGLSIEWRVIQDQFIGMTRHIRDAVMVGLAVVDRAAYKDSTIEQRWQEQRAKRWYF